MNKIFLIGNLTRNPETRTTPNGVSVCSFGIAVNRRFAGKDGNRETDFFNINVWRQQGESCQRYLEKGRKVAVVGELQARTYQANDGTTRISLDVTADEVEFLTPKGAQEGGGGYAAPSASNNAAMQEFSAGFANADDDLPF